MNKDIKAYNRALSNADGIICELLCNIIDTNLRGAISKIWHSHPVWFLGGNPIVGYSKLKNDVQLLFWSGQSFDEEGLYAEGSFKAAQIRYTDVSQIDQFKLKLWLKKAKTIQWDYKNIVKHKGVLNLLK
jgi:hypothetical protein